MEKLKKHTIITLKYENTVFTSTDNLIINSELRCRNRALGGC